MSQEALRKNLRERGREDPFRPVRSKSGKFLSSLGALGFGEMRGGETFFVFFQKKSTGF